MAATATASSADPTFAPPDPTLPKPWKGLVDGKTGYLYFWNPMTNVTQYERPTIVDSVPKSSPMRSSIQIQQYSEVRYGYNPDKENDRYEIGNNGASKPEPVSRFNQNASGGPILPHNTPNGTHGSVVGGSSAGRHGLVAEGSNLSGDAYRHQHEITVTGHEVPSPFSSFEATGFSSEILREVRCLLLGGANVVRCGSLFGGLVCNLSCPYMVDQFLEGFLNDLRSELGLLLLIIQSVTRSERKRGLLFLLA